MTYSLSNLFKTLSLFLAAIVVSACANGPKVATDYDKTYNFAALKSFAIKEAAPSTAADIKASPFTLKHIQSVVTNELGKRFQNVSADVSPDFFVTYHLVVEDKLDTRDADFMLAQAYMGGTARHPSPFFYGASFGSGIKTYPQGSLIIDFVDAKTLQPIWRGVSNKRLGRATPDQEREILSQAVVEVLQQFPPH